MIINIFKILIFYKIFTPNFGEHFLMPKIRQLGVLTPFLLFRSKSLKPFLARWEIFFNLILLVKWIIFLVIL